MDQLRKVYVIYDHEEDQEYYDLFRDRFQPDIVSAVYCDICPVLFEEDLNYTINRLMGAVTSASVVIVLCGKNTWGLSYVDLELMAALNQRKGLIGVYLPTNARNREGKFKIPARLRDNLKSGFAAMVHWDAVVAQPFLLTSHLRAAARSSMTLINNSRHPRSDDTQLRVAATAAGAPDENSRFSYWLPRWWRATR